MSPSPRDDPEDTGKDELDDKADADAGQYRVSYRTVHPHASLGADRSPPPPRLPAAEPTDDQQPVKRGRGRPKGSKNKKAVPTPAGEASSSATPRKRGRPPKEKKDEEKEDESGGEEEPTPKRKRGRPPKPAVPTDPNAEPKKRGRPPKKVEKPASASAA
ncbi:hypothetical protein C8R44DRAFT_884346 [Mycena epipterygia]|nr:hypothetical protein C8R44DRAFT_884346 [Mycena epipterygia]